MNVSQPGHPGVSGVSDFETSDELYMGIVFEEGNDVFITGDAEDGTYPWRGEDTFMPGGTFPLGWTRSYGEGRVFVTAAGPQRPQLQDAPVPADSAERRGVGHRAARPAWLASSASSATR